MKRSKTVFFVVFLSFQVSELLASPLKVTTFNVQNYGSGGYQSDDTDKISIENRDKTINEFLTKEDLLSSDVMVFEEILDYARFSDKVLKNKFICLTYPHNNSAHQHVILCHKPELKFITAQDDDNFTLEDVAMTNLRPALHGILTTEEGKPLLHIIGVHLKAYPESAETRLKQVQMIAAYIKKHNAYRPPFLLLGDFNTFNDDVERMQKIFRDSKVPIFEVNNPYSYTYRTTKQKSKLDRLWISQTRDIVVQVWVSGPCNDSEYYSSQYQSIAQYNKEVSDHCPVSVNLDLP